MALGQQDGFDESSLTPVAPSGGTPAFGTGELEQGIRPTGWGKFAEMARQVSFDSPVGFMPGYEGAWIRGISDYLINKDLDKQGKTKLTPQQANELYPGLPKPFDEPIHREVADLIFSDNERRKKLQSWVDRGPEGNFRGVGALVGGAMGGLMGIEGGIPGIVLGAAGGAGIGAAGGVNTLSALDPVNLALNVTGGNVARAFKLKPSTVLSLGENLAINAATEVPTYFQKKAERQDVSLGETAAGIAGSALLGAGISRALHITAEYMSKAPTSVREQALKTAIEQHENGRATDVSPIGATTTLREGGETAPGQPKSYSWKELQSPSERLWYAGRSADTNELIPMDRDVPGLHLTDDGMVANNLAADPEGPFTGKVAQFEVPENAKFLDLEKPVVDPEVKAFVGALEKKLGIDDLPEGAKVSELLDEIQGRVADGSLPQAAMTEVVGAAKELGFDGYRYVREIDGSTRHNGLVLFDEGRAKLKEEFTANKEIAPSMRDGESITNGSRPGEVESSRTFSPDTDQELQELKAPKMSAEPAAELLDPVVKDQQVAAERQLKEIAKDDPAIQEELDGLKSDQALHKQEAQVLRDFAECYLKGMI